MAFGKRGVVPPAAPVVERPRRASLRRHGVAAILALVCTSAVSAAGGTVTIEAYTGLDRGLAAALLFVCLHLALVRLLPSMAAPSGRRRRTSRTDGGTTDGSSTWTRDDRRDDRRDDPGGTDTCDSGSDGGSDGGGGGDGGGD